MKVQTVGIKGFYNERAGCWSWTPEIVIAFDPLEPELTKSEASAVQQALISCARTLQGTVDKLHRDENALEEDALKKDAELRRQEEEALAAAACPYPIGGAPAEPQPAAEAPAPASVPEPEAPKEKPAAPAPAGPRRDKSGYLIDLFPRDPSGKYPPGYNPTASSWVACPYCGTTEITHKRTEGEGNWQGCKKCNAGLTRGGTIYALKKSFPVGPAGQPGFF